MRRHGEAAKENKRPPGMGTGFQPHQCLDHLRRPLGERKPCNKAAGVYKAASAMNVDVTPCLKWLEGTVARSRVVNAAKQEREAVSSVPKSPVKDTYSSILAAPGNNAPPAQPSCSPDIGRKKSSRDLEGCFGIGPTVKGDVRDRRKSKPRALLTVEALPNVATLVSREKQSRGLPRPGRASLEWISDDPDSEASTTDISGTCDGSSGDSSLCSGFSVHQGLLDQWQHLRASKIYGKQELLLEDEVVEFDASSESLSDSWETVPQHCLTEVNELVPTKSDLLRQHSEADTVMGAYESCQSKLQQMRASSVLSPSNQSLRAGLCEPRLSHVLVADALQKLTATQFQRPHISPDESTGHKPASAASKGYDSLSEQVRGLQAELKGLMRSESWK